MCSLNSVLTSFCLILLYKFVFSFTFNLIFKVYKVFTCFTSQNLKCSLGALIPSLIPSSPFSLLDTIFSSFCFILLEFLFANQRVLVTRCACTHTHTHTLLHTHIHLRLTLDWLNQNLWKRGPWIHFLKKQPSQIILICYQSWRKNILKIFSLPSVMPDTLLPFFTRAS